MLGNSRPCLCCCSPERKILHDLSSSRKEALHVHQLGRIHRLCCPLFIVDHRRQKTFCSHAPGQHCQQYLPSSNALTLHLGADLPIDACLVRCVAWHFMNLLMTYPHLMQGAAKSAHSAHSPCPSDRQLSSGRHAARSSANMGPPADLSLPPSILNNGSPHLSSADIISTPESAASFGQVMSLERPAMLLNIPRETGSVSGAKILEPGMHGFLEEQGPGKYGRRAAAHVRTGRWQKRPSGTGASAPDSKACQLHPDQSLVSSLRMPT